MTTTLIVVLTLVVRRCQAINQTSADGRRDGWVSQPNGRGTFDILWYHHTSIRQQQPLIRPGAVFSPYFYALGPYYT